MAPFVLFALLPGCDPLARGDRAWEEGDAAAVVESWGGRELDAGRRQRLARAYMELGRSSEAAVAIAGLAPLDAHGRMVEGGLAAEAGDFRAALQAYEAGFALEPLPELAVNVCAARLALDDQPLEACQRAVEAAPQDPVARLGLADAAARAGLRDAARAALESAAGADPAWEAGIWLALGEYERACASGASTEEAGLGCVGAGRAEQARAILEPMGTPSAAAALFRLAVDEAEAAHPGPDRELALARAARWEAKAPDDAATWTDRGRQASLQGEVAAAEAAWSQAILLDPQEPAPRLDLARSRARRGEDPAPALEGCEHWLCALERDLEQAFSITCTSPDCAAAVAYAKARLLVKRGDLDGARAQVALAVAAGGAPVAAQVSRDPELEPLRLAEGQLFPTARP